jgi:hypothetical protein
MLHFELAGSLKGFPLALPLVNQSKQPPTRCVLPAIIWLILSIHSCYYLRVSVVLFCPGQTLLNAHCADSPGILTWSISGGIAKPLLSVYGRKTSPNLPLTNCNWQKPYDPSNNEWILTLVKETASRWPDSDITWRGLTITVRSGEWTEKVPEKETA